MQAAILKSFGAPLVIEMLPDPRPGAGEAVVDVVAAPVLAYAAKVFSGERAYPLLLPMAVGVGAVGRVCSVGPDATRLAPGDWVFCDPTVRSRDEATAPDIMLQGWIAPDEGAKRLQSHFHHGPFAQQMLMPLESAVRLGKIDESEAGRWCALGSFLVPYGGLLAAELRAGEAVLINGATGHFGSAAVAVALAMGAARVVATGRNEAALGDLISRFGPRVATVVFSGDADEDTGRMKEAARGPIDKALDILPPLPNSTATRAAVLTVRPYGTVVLMGGSRVELELPYAHLMRNSITVRGQYMYPRDAAARVVGMTRSGLLSLAEFKVTNFGLGQVNEAVAYSAAHGGPFQMTVVNP